jgi:hypothetical protein
MEKVIFILDMENILPMVFLLAYLSREAFQGRTRRYLREFDCVDGSSPFSYRLFLLSRRECLIGRLPAATGFAGVQTTLASPSTGLHAKMLYTVGLNFFLTWALWEVIRYPNSI